MNLRYYSLIGSVFALVTGGALMSPTRAYAQENAAEELTRGPVHEAFASSISFDPEPGIIVRTAPPELIEEIPPDQQLEGENVTWIPGYWAWDEEQGDFIWISGVWRNLPPGREWIPGYWGEVSGQWQWTSGYWEDEELEEVTYLPQPPKSIESGPNVEAPSSSHIWISGSWVNRENRYAWRPGYWEPGQENWTWIPAHYRWTPRGYVYVNGYWDYDVDRRGIVFAPVRIRREYYSRPDYYYTPLTVISLAVFTNHLFVRPRYSHYYFGDYYEPRYRNEGFYASYSYQSSRLGYDPFYAHDRWRYRDDRNWERNRRETFEFYRDHEEARPPRTWAALRARPEGKRRGDRDDFEFAQPLSTYVERPNRNQRFQPVTAERRTKLVAQRQELSKFKQERQKTETRREDKDKSGQADKVDRVKREKSVKSPVIAKRPEELAGKDAPPKRRETKDADLREDKKNGDSKASDNEKSKKDDNAKKAEEPGKMDKSDKDNRGENGKKPEAGGKKETKEESRPSPKTDAERQKGSDKKAEPARDNDEGKRSKPDAEPARKAEQPKQPKEDKEKAKPAPTPAPAQSNRQAEPTPRPKTTTEPSRRPETQPQRQATPEKKDKKKEPDASQARQSPERQPQAQARQEPAPVKRQAEMSRREPKQASVKPVRETEKATSKPAASGKKSSDDEEEEEKKKNR